MTESTESTSKPSLPLLTDEMRAATREDHDKSDRLVNLKLALVLTSPALYGEALGLFLPVFETLESILDRNATHPQLGKLHPMMKILRRTPGFRADLEYYLTRERREALQESWNKGDNEVILEYVQRLETLEKEDPIRVLAYAYHLYGGVLAGGQMIARTVRQAMGLPKDSNNGVKVFQVEDDVSMSNKGVFQRVKSIYNQDLELSAREKEALIQEGKEVFRRNNALVGTVKGTEAWQQAADSFTKKVLLICCILIAMYFAWHVFAMGSGGVLQHGY